MEEFEWDIPLVSETVKQKAPKLLTSARRHKLI